MYLGTFVAAWLGMRARSKVPWSRVKPEHVDDAVFASALGAVVGGRIGYMLFYGHEQLLGDPLSLIKVWQGGMSFHGGLAGVLVAMAVYSRHARQPFFAFMDAVAPWFPIGFFLVRVGNFINAELWGKETGAPWAVVYRGVPRHASQLYEAALEGIVLFVVLWTFTRKPRPMMAASALFLIGYSVFRIAIELVRVPDRQLGYLGFGWLTMGQVLSAPMLVAGVILWVLVSRKNQGKGQPVPTSAV